MSSWNSEIRKTMKLSLSTNNNEFFWQLTVIIALFWRLTVKVLAIWRMKVKRLALRPYLNALSHGATLGTVAKLHVCPPWRAIFLGVLWTFGHDCASTWDWICWQSFSAEHPFPWKHCLWLLLARYQKRFQRLILPSSFKVLSWVIQLYRASWITIRTDHINENVCVSTGVLPWRSLHFYHIFWNRNLSSDLCPDFCPSNCPIFFSLRFRRPI